MILYSYFRSSASYRVRIALALKGLPHEYAGVHLVKGGGEQHASDYRSLNPEGLVPTLLDDSNVLTQSLAIIEYLDERHPSPPLLPKNPADRAFVRSIALQIACDIHPVNNLRVLQYLTKRIGITDEQKTEWYRHWIDLGFEALESRLASDPRVGRFVFGDSPTLADVCLVPQAWNARRFNIPLDGFPTISRLVDHASSCDAFIQAEPGNQPDAEGSV